MALFEITKTSFRPIAQASFSEVGILERSDLQRLLRNQLSLLGEDLFLIAEEFGEWEQSNRRIDLLAIDRDANLVVIELKRTIDGGHMDLQSIRYASMVSTMTFEQAEKVHEFYLSQNGRDSESIREKLLAFLGWSDVDEEEFGKDVRIILVSENFGKELTTAVLWLRDRDININCIRLTPYIDDHKIMVDIEQIIPLPEIIDYQIQLREKTQLGKKHRSQGHNDRYRFWQGLLQICKARNTRHSSASPNTRHWLSGKSAFSGLNFNYTIAKDLSAVELYIDRGLALTNKALFDNLLSQRPAIEKSFGCPLIWERLDEKKASKIKYVIEIGGYASSEDIWFTIHDKMVDAMERLILALEPYLSVTASVIP